MTGGARVKQRSVYFPDDLWTRIRLKAVMEGRSASDLVVEAAEQAFPPETAANRSTVAVATSQEGR